MHVSVQPLTSFYYYYNFIFFCFQKRVGIFDILDEVSNYRQAVDESFIAAITKRHGDNPRFEKSKVELMFGIHHFAAMVSTS